MSKNQAVNVKKIHIKASNISNRLKSIYDPTEDIISIEIINNSNHNVLLSKAERSKELRNNSIMYCVSQKKTVFMLPKLYLTYKGPLRLRYLDKNYDKDNRSGSVDIILYTSLR